MKEEKVLILKILTKKLIKKQKKKMELKYKILLQLYHKEMYKILINQNSVLQMINLMIFWKKIKSYMMLVLY